MLCKSSPSIPGMCRQRHSTQSFQEKVPGFPNNCISSMHLNQPGVEGLVSHHPRSGRDPRQHQSGGTASCLSNTTTCCCGVNTQSVSEHSPGCCTPGFCVCMCSTNRHQAQGTSCLGLFSSPGASGQQVSQPGKRLFSISATKAAQETIKP